MITGTSGRAALAFGKSSRPLMPGMLMSVRIRISEAAPASAICRSASAADRANCIMNRSARSPSSAGR